MMGGNQGHMGMGKPRASPGGKGTASLLKNSELNKGTIMRKIWDFCRSAFLKWTNWGSTSPETKCR